MNPDTLTVPDTLIFRDTVACSETLTCPDTLTCQALLNCLIREVSAPERQTWHDGGCLVIRLARSGTLLRARLRNDAGYGTGHDTGRAWPRPTGEAEISAGGAWRPVTWEELAGRVADELTLATGVRNAEFVGQIQASHRALTAITRARISARPDPRITSAPFWSAELPAPAAGSSRAGCRYLASEQALAAGHRFHPTPKARDGAPSDWLRYAPEAGARFPLRFLAVHEDVLAGEGDTAALDRLGGPGGPAVPAGYRLLPAHPWQLRLLEGRPWLRDTLRRGLLVDLGDGEREVAATSSVRTVYDPASDVFCKFSLNVRLTNCVRKSAWYELAGSVALTGLLREVMADVAHRTPGAVLLGEPGYRTVSLAAKDAYEGLAVIVREGIRGRVAAGVTPLVAASLTEPRSRFFAGREPDCEPDCVPGREPGWLAGWWEAYLRLVVPPVLDLYFRHGVVLEPHLQNVLVGVDEGDWPAQVIFRDLEGVKLVGDRHEGLLRVLAPGVARGLAYDPRRGWDRVAYCLLVNHLAEIAAAIAGYGVAERELWRAARRVLAEAAGELGNPPELRAVLAGVPLPAKANLRVRWSRDADRDASYVPVPNPLGGSGGFDLGGPGADR